MFPCARCQGRELVRAKRGGEISWECPQCRGQLFGVGILRRLLPKKVFNTVWQAAISSPGSGSARCPTCAQPMRNFQTEVEGSPLALDVCKSCYLIWFDDHELEALPVQKNTEKELSPEAREAIANLEIALMRERAEAEGVPDAEWKTVPALFRLPIEENAPELESKPWLTWGLTAVALVVSLGALYWKPQWIRQFGLIPAQFQRYGGLTFLTSFFLHGDLWHLISNLYFLLIFGDNVEDYLGRLRYGLLLLAATVCGGAMEVALRPDAGLPLVGASGGISGILAFYAFNFPKARIALIPSLQLYLATSGRFWLRLPVMWALVLWIILQLLGFYQEWHHVTEIAYLAHLSGLIVGVIFWLAWRRTETGSFQGL